MLIDKKPELKRIFELPTYIKNIAQTSAIALIHAENSRVGELLSLLTPSTKQHNPNVRAYFQHLIDNGKKPLQPSAP